MTRWMAQLMIHALIVLAVALAGSTTSGAQVQIDKRKPLAPGSLVQIENSFGALTITGWDKHEIWAKGTLAPGALRLDLETGTDDEDEDEDEEDGEDGERSKKKGDADDDEEE
jgi:hypothetical protein